VVFQEEPGPGWFEASNTIWVPKRTIGEAIRAAMQFVQAHTAFDVRPRSLPLAAFPPAAQKYWNAFRDGHAGVAVAARNQAERGLAHRGGVRHALPADGRRARRTWSFRGQRERYMHCA